MKAVIVTGDRYAERGVWMPIVDKAIQLGFVVVIQGGAAGIDSIALSACDSVVRSSLTMPAQWGKHGKAAGPKRNAAMLSVLITLKEHGYDVAVLAFHDEISASKGTKDMANRSIRAGVETWLYTTYNDPKRLTEVIA